MLSGKPEEQKFCIIIPLYNHGETIERVVTRCIKHGLKIFVIDDGSTDGGADRIRNYDKVSIFRFDKNQGKGKALRKGFEIATAEGFTHAVCCDADMQHDPEEIPVLLRASRKNPDAIILGNRKIENGSMPLLSRFGRRLSNFWFFIETFKIVGDAQCGFRIYPLQKIRNIKLHSSRFEMEHELLVKASWNSVKILDVPIKARYEPNRISHFNLLYDNLLHSILNSYLVITRYSPAYLLHKKKPTASTPADNQWYRQKTLGNKFGYDFFKYLYKLGGKKPAYLWLKPVIKYYTIFGPSEGRRSSLIYLKKRFPIADEKSLREHQKKHFHSFGEMILDRLIITVDGFEKFTILSSGVENIKMAVAEGRGVILLGAHIGNFEIAAFALETENIRVKIVGVRKEIEKVEKYLHARYKKKSLPYETITLEEPSSFAFIKIPRLLQEGSVVAMLGDRLWGDKYLTHKFLGHEARFPAGPFLLSSITGAPIVTWFAVKDDIDTYHFYANPPFHVPHASRKSREKVLTSALSIYVKAIEDILQKYPYQWYNFYNFWSE